MPRLRLLFPCCCKCFSAPASCDLVCAGLSVSYICAHVKALLILSPLDTRAYAPSTLTLAPLYCLCSHCFLDTCIRIPVPNDMDAVQSRNTHSAGLTQESALPPVIRQGTVQSRLRQLHSLAHDSHQLQPDPQFLEWERDIKQVSWGQRSATTKFDLPGEAAPSGLLRGLQHKHTFIGLNTGRRSHGAAHAFTDTGLDANDCPWEVSGRAKPTDQAHNIVADEMAGPLRHPQLQAARRELRPSSSMPGLKGTNSSISTGQSPLSGLAKHQFHVRSAASSPITEAKKRQSARDLYAQYSISRPSG